MKQNEQTPVLEVKHLSKSLSGRPIIRDLSFSVFPGEIFGFLGPNGSGKTTTIKLMLGLLRPDAGEIRICGHDIATEYEKAFAQIGGIIENPELYHYLTGWENLNLFRRMYDDIPKSRIDEVVALVGLQARINDKVSRYSLGMRQRLGVAQALLNHPKLLVFDEPTNGLDPEGIRDLRDLLKKLCREEGVSVFVSSHLLAEIEQMCDKVAVLDRGALVGIRSMEEMHRILGAADGRPLYLFRTDSADSLMTLLKDHGFSPEKDKEGVVLPLSSEEVQTVLSLAAGNGVPLLGFGEVKRSLEDAFLELTGAGRASGGAARAVGVNENAEDPTPVLSLDGTKSAPSADAGGAATREETVYIPPSERKEESEETEGGSGQ